MPTFSAKAKLTGLLLLLPALLGPQVAQADDVLIRNRPNVGVNQRLEFSDLVRICRDLKVQGRKSNS